LSQREAARRDEVVDAYYRVAFRFFLPIFNLVAFGRTKRAF